MTENYGKPLREILDDELKRSVDSILDKLKNDDSTDIPKDKQQQKNDILKTLSTIYTSCANVNDIINNVSKEFRGGSVFYNSFDIVDATMDAILPVIVNVTSMICALKKSVDSDDYAALTSHVAAVNKFKKYIEMTNNALKEYLE